MNMTTVGTLPPPSSPLLTESAKVIEAVVATCIVITAVVGNLLTCVTIKRLHYRTRDNKNAGVMGILLMNLAISDIAAAVLVMPFSILQTFLPEVMLNTTVCVYACLSQRLFLTTSIFLLTAISVARYYGVCKTNSGKDGWVFHLKTAIVACWLLGVVNMLVPILNIKHIQYNPMFEICDTLSSYSVENEQLVDFIILGIEYSACLLVILWSYGNIYGKAKVTFKDSLRQGLRDVKTSAKAERRVTGMLLACVILYFICWMPMMIHLTYMHVTSELISPEYAIISVWFAYANSALNPFVYAFSSAVYRQEMKKILYDLFTCRQCSSVKERGLKTMRRQLSNESTQTTFSIEGSGTSPL